MYVCISPARSRRVRFTFARNARVMQPRGIRERTFPVVSHRKRPRPRSELTRPVLRESNTNARRCGERGRASRKFRRICYARPPPPIIMRRESNLWGPIADIPARPFDHDSWLRPGRTTGFRISRPSRRR